MNDSNMIQQHLDRAQKSVDLISLCEEELDALFYGQRLDVIPELSDEFFSYTSHGSPPAIPKNTDGSAVLSNRKVDFGIDAAPTEIKYPDDFAQIVGQRIREVRESRKLTQAELAEITGIKRPNIARLEKGQNFPNVSTILRIAEGLGLTAAKILEL